MRYINQSVLNTLLSLIIGVLLQRYIGSPTKTKSFIPSPTMSGLKAGDSFPDQVEFS